MKVMCIANSHQWTYKKQRTITVTKKYFFGLFTKTEIKDNSKADGPRYGEICTVIESCKEDGILYYYLAEWNIDGNRYDSKNFIPIQEESQANEAVKEAQGIADSSDSILNHPIAELLSNQF